MSEYNPTKDTVLSIVCGVILGCMFIGIPTESGLWFAYFWKAIHWAIQNGWF